MMRTSFGNAVLACSLVLAACGGESTSDGSGGSGAGGAGGGSGGFGAGTSGGSGGLGAGTSGGSGGAGGVVSGGGGTGACGQLPGGMDCVSCNGFTLPVCQNGSWTCPPQPPCPPECDPNQVATVDGCLGCSEASAKLAAGIEAARKANGACGTAADCTLTAAGTACAGACPIAVSKSGEAAFQAALAKLDADYCKGFVPVCGYTTPKCAVPTLECNAGACEAKFQ